MSAKAPDRLTGTRRRSGGFALLMVLMLIAAASVVGISYIYGSQIKTAGTNNLILASEARYLAESGLQHGLYGLQTGATPFGSAGAPNGRYHVVGGDGGYVFYIRATATPNDYQIVGMGTEEGISQTIAMTARLTSDYAKKMNDLNPKHWWRLGDSGLTAVDEKEDKDGTYVNGVTRGVGGALIGDLDTCADFDGVNDYVQLLEIEKVPGDKLTIGCWAKADGWASAWPCLIARCIGTAGPNDQFFMLGMDPGRNLRFVLNVNNVGVDLRSAGKAVHIGEWFFAVATFNKNQQRMNLYKNGELIASRITILGGQVKDDDRLEVRIGDTPQGDPRRWRGPIDEVFIIHETLSAEQIKELYDARIAGVEVISWDD